MEDQCRIVAENWKKQDEEKQNALRVNSVKMEAHITKQDISFEEIFPTVENFWSDTKTTEDSNDFDLQIILSLVYRFDKVLTEILPRALLNIFLSCVNFRNVITWIRVGR